jgi:hypothetical protein
VIGASTQLASVGVALDMRQAMLDSLPHDIGHERMKPKWGRDQKTDARVLAGRRCR